MIVNIFSTSRSLVKRRMRTDIIAENGRAAGETSPSAEDGKGARFRKWPLPGRRAQLRMAAPRKERVRKSRGVKFACGKQAAAT